MSDKIKPIDIIAKAVAAATESLFRPTDDQQKAKSGFWFAVAQGQVPQDSLQPDSAIAVKFAGDSRIARWWDTPGFIDWFYNREEFLKQAAYVGEISLTGLEKLLTSPLTSVKDKLTAIKLGFEVAGKLQKSEGQSTSDQISKMTRTELEAYISKRAGLLPKPDSDDSELTS